jgi:3-oxoacyl-[acyl-carrier protein] reductase
MVDTKLKDKVALITGANNPYGIGAAVAKALSREGARVFLQYFRSNESSVSLKMDSNEKYNEAFYFQQQTKNCDEVLASIRELGSEAYAVEYDLSDSKAIPTIFDEVEKAYGRIHILVNNAAHWLGDTFIPPDQKLKNELVELWTSKPATIDTYSFDKLFSINTRAPVLLMKEFVSRYLKNNLGSGRIVNISTAGAYCFPSEISYGASKFALESYTRSAAVELGKYGITVNALSLGPVQTGWINAALEKEILPSIPLGRLGSPEDVADVVVFLASYQARWITGQRIYIGGGHGM